MAVADWTVTSSSHGEGNIGGSPVWLVTYRVPPEVLPGRELHYYLPTVAVEFRAAEYGLTTVDDVVEVLLWEPILRTYRHQAGWGDLTPGLMIAEQARAMVRAQIADARQRFAALEVEPGALAVIGDEARVDPVVVAARRLEIDAERLAGRG